jgi:hypothetical protein
MDIRTITTREVGNGIRSKDNCDMFEMARIGNPRHLIGNPRHLMRICNPRYGGTYFISIWLRSFEIYATDVDH